MEIDVKMWISILNVLIAASFFMSANSEAECQGSQNRPSQQFFVIFSSNSYEITKSERMRLSRWVLEMNSRYLIQNWIDVVGNASESEADFNHLAKKRASVVAKAIIDDGLINAPFQILTEIYPANSVAEASGEDRITAVQVSPGCPNNCCTSP